ncbi:UPF0182 family protein [Leptolyngbya sp. FACHB-261]|uniref:UPF0182 family protein n=1 Tax=Leptolyngbya sp. FACHB-261 TaxID=2692806 RepID=UPI001F54E4F4|nr:UPF0182 family protein [Leptolyngbya sp. FACHB-261]
MSFLLSRWSWVLGLALIGFGFLVDQAITLAVESFWFAEVDYLSVFATSLGVRLLLWLAGFVLALLILGSDLSYVWRRTVLPRAKFRDQELGSWLKRLLIVSVLGLSAVMAEFFSKDWLPVLTWLNQVRFETQDPLFHQDLAFYMYSLPVWQALLFWSLLLWLLVLGSSALLYGLRQRLTTQPDSSESAKTIVKATAQRLPLAASQHLLWLVGVLWLHVALTHWLSRYDLLYSSRGVIFGANYADVHAQLPANWFLAGISLLSAVACFWLGWHSLKNAPTKTLLLLVGGYVLSFLLIGVLYPQVIQAFVVLPNELERELPYIERNIQFTRQGYNLTNVETQAFTLKDNLTYKDIQNNPGTIRNIRLWDSQPLLETYRQLQEIRPYYQFPTVDVDRYSIDGELRQVMHSARELDYSQVPRRARTWVNQHFFYTHGYGFTLSPVNIVTHEGLPDFFIKDIPPQATSPAIETAIPVDNPSIYYGELTRTNVFVSTTDKELDYPQGNQNVYASYTGTGGVPVARFWQRLLYAWHFRDPRMLPANEFTDQSRFMFRRNIQERVQTIAPFLRYDRDPYMVIEDGRLYWFLDAYTTSTHYPYSEPSDAPFDFNYIRNAVKVVIDAYNVSVDFYVSDPQDPLIRTYQRSFPALLQPLEKLPQSLRRHLRYPEDLFQVQAQQYATYHMDDSQVFYNKEDQWHIPPETRQGITQPMRPNYLILKLPNQQNQKDNSLPEEFALLSPFTPSNKDNLIAWMAARCDAEEYGKLLVYEFSKQSQFLGLAKLRLVLIKPQRSQSRFLSGTSMVRA